MYKPFSMLEEFKKFALKGNVVDMAVGIIIGAAFTKVVSSFVTDIMMPPIALLTGNTDFGSKFLVLRAGPQPGPYDSLAQAQTAGAITFNYGMFLNSTISFLITSFALFIFIKKIINLRHADPAPAAVAAPTTKDCAFCATSIPVKARRCPNCTSDIS